MGSSGAGGSPSPHVFQLADAALARLYAERRDVLICPFGRNVLLFNNSCLCVCSHLWAAWVTSLLAIMPCTGSARNFYSAPL